MPADKPEDSPEVRQDNGAADEAFCAVVWEALKGDHNDLRKQQMILRAHRAGKADLLEALKAMLAHSCVADAHPEDKDPADHAAERLARAALTKAAQ